MAALQIDQFTQALFGKAESVIIVCAILTVVVGIPLYWLRLKAERGLIRVIVSRSLPLSSTATLAALPAMSLTPVAPFLSYHKSFRIGV